MPEKFGYCERCRQNCVHVQVPGFFSTLNRLFLNTFQLVGVSNWSCYECRASSVLLSPEQSHADTVFPNGKTIAGDRNGQNAPPASDQPAGSFSATSAAKPNAAGESGCVKSEVVGNFLRQDQSLARRSQRGGMFTEKFREGIVKRILAGATTIAEVRRQHDLTESDVIAWIKESFDSKQNRLDQLNREVKMLSEFKDEPDFSNQAVARRIKIDDQMLIEGRVSAK